jgi:serine/threonine protein kinase
VNPTSVQIWERIHSAGLATSDECRQWAMSIAQAGGQQSLLDSGKLVTELIRSGRITSFQGNVLFRHLPIPLIVGSYKLTRSLESDLGKDWFEAIEVGRAESTLLWLQLLTQSKLKSNSNRTNPPSLRWAQQHVALTHPSLDRWVYAGVADSNLIAVARAIPGQSIAAMLTERRLGWDESSAMIEQIASGLLKLHGSGMVHGDLNMQSIWRDDDAFVLRRNPLFLPANPYGRNGLDRQPIDEPHSLAYAAPELTQLSTQPSIQTDLYALGCLWHRVSAGEVLFEVPAQDELNAEVWASAHCTQDLSSVLHRSVPGKFRWCLGKLLAKNPIDRFTDCSELLQSIENALSSKGTIKQTVAPKLETVSLAPQPKSQPASVGNPTVAKPTEAKPTVEKPKIVPAAVAGKSPVSTILPPSRIVGDAPPVASALRLIESGASEQKAVPKLIERPTIASPLVETAPLPVPIPESLQAQELEPVTLVSPQPSVVPSPSLESTTAEMPVLPRRKKSTNSTKSTIGKKSSEKASNNSAAKGKKKGKKKGKPKWLLPAMMGGTCLLFAAMLPLLLRNGSSSVPVKPIERTVVIEKPANPETKTGPNSNGVPKPSAPSDPLAEYFSVVADDGKLLWAPPHAGSPFSTEMLPAGFEGIVFLSSNTWQQRGKSAEVAKWWMAAQPALESLTSSVPYLNDERIESVAIALYPGKSQGNPQAVFRMKLRQPTTIASLTSGLTGFEVQMFDPKSGSKRGFWGSDAKADPMAVAMDDLTTIESATTQRICVGPQELILGLNELSGGVAPVRRQLEKLLQATDSRSDLTALIVPSFLTGDGRELVSTWPGITSLIAEVVDDSTQGILFSTTFEPQWYSELRLLNADIREVGRSALRLKTKLDQLPDTIEAILRDNPSNVYWRALAMRYPQMLRSLSKYGRFGMEEGEVVANVYLPNDAVSNILIASWMGLTEGSSASVTTTKTTTKPAGKSIDEILDSKISIAFDQESLESALQRIATEVSESVLSGEPMTMMINGGAFKIQGITQNQSIRDFKQSSVPVRTVLTDLVRRANPVTTVKSATEKDQKVVWIVIDDPDRAGKKKIELTTRTWAETNKATLPNEFVP